jgi:hypothetical protein
VRLGDVTARPWLRLRFVGEEERRANWSGRSNALPGNTSDGQTLLEHITGAAFATPRPWGARYAAGVNRSKHNCLSSAVAFLK